ncbi:hypothetical protein FS749_002019 [Ceratobasidium sp. UAMH 11750]|nr:hypothetical protein FS749_002019 [Ceratobasidium sp. UAMH 11750]
MDSFQMNIEVVGDAPDTKRWRFEYVSDECDTVDIQSSKQQLLAQQEEIQRLQRQLLGVPEEKMSVRRSKAALN